MKVTRELEVANVSGLHTRVSSLICQKAQEFQSEIFLGKNGYQADAKSILDLLSLGAACGDIVRLEAIGVDSQQAADAIAELFQNLFDEESH